MHEPRLNPRGRRLAMWNYVLTAELHAGTQFLMAMPEQALYAVSGITGEVMPLPRPGTGGGEKWFAYFSAMYGLSEREDQSKMIYDALRSYVIRHGTRVNLRRFAAFTHENNTAYMSAYNGRMYKIEPDFVTEVPIGEDGVFFADDDNGCHVEPDINGHGELIERVTNLNFAPSGLSGITPEQQKKALTIWMFMLAFPDLMPTKPLLLVEGAQGAGKTASILLLQLILMGAKRPMILRRNQEDDFGVTLLRAPIALFDNTDSYIDWVPDAVCAYATSGQWTKRKLYSDDQEVVIKPHAFIAVASKNPASFRREDTADRCIILRLERRARFMRFERLERQALQDRARLLGEYLWYVQQLVADIRTIHDDDAESETHRMADFAAFGRRVGRVLGWSIDDVSDLMLALQSERDAFINEEDPLLDVLQKWIVYPARSGLRNPGRLISVFGLLSELETIAQADNISWKYSPKTLVQKLRSPHIEREFHIEMSMSNGQKSFQIWRQGDVRLKIIDGGTEIEQ
jgi:hypothetical protein